MCACASRRMRAHRGPVHKCVRMRPAACVREETTGAADSLCPPRKLCNSRLEPSFSYDRFFSSSLLPASVLVSLGSPASFRRPSPRCSLSRNRPCTLPLPPRLDRPRLESSRRGPTRFDSTRVSRVGIRGPLRVLWGGPTKTGVIRSFLSFGHSFSSELLRNGRDSCSRLP